MNFGSWNSLLEKWKGFLDNGPASRAAGSAMGCKAGKGSSLARVWPDWKRVVACGKATPARTASAWPGY
jgi:hypothetical protein